MALFTALLAVGVILCWRSFMQIATSNIWLNGVIIGVTLFGVGLCFVHMFRLLPEYRWAREYYRGNKNAALPPRLLRPVAMILRRGGRVPVATMGAMLDMIMMRMEDSRESVRYITNTLVFLGLLGTFWGLIMTVGGFAELIGGLNFEDEAVLTAMQAGLAQPMAGMATAFTSSLMGLAGSLTVGFLALQMQMAQNTIFNELEDYLASRARVPASEELGE
ncbi:MAG: hypothetical protein K2I81_01175 [Alphaproteobacteria bacterium]|nr:hypothetical protein [Alphaproteobacteria bacterium]